MKLTSWTIKAVKPKDNETKTLRRTRVYASQNIPKGKYAENQMRGFKPAFKPQGINPHFTFSKFTGRIPAFYFLEIYRTVSFENLGEEQQAHYNNTRLALAAAFRTKFC